MKKKLPGLCVCVCGGDGGGERERARERGERKRKRERERDRERKRQRDSAREGEREKEREEVDFLITLYKLIPNVRSFRLIRTIDICVTLFFYFFNFSNDIFIVSPFDNCK